MKIVKLMLCFVAMVTLMFWCYENGEATVTNASERYDV